MSDEEMSTPRIRSDGSGQYDFFGEHMECYRVESSAVHRKLQSKVEALRILRQELEKFRVERDQYKLMAETLQLRYSALKRNSDFSGCLALSDKSSVAALLHETRGRNLKLTTEVETLKQKLNELQGDIELLRAKEPNSARRLKCDGRPPVHNASMKEEVQWKMERANFICHLESLKKKNAQLAFDFKALIDEKEEIVTERDAYKCKAHRLNHELFVALKANESHPKFLDIDAILLENKYLHERLKCSEDELDLARQSASKYKTMLDSKRKKGIIKLSSSSNDECVLSAKQVNTILESGIELPPKTETVQDFKSLSLALLDNLNDKSLALSHQKKTNKILATKIAELEQRLQSVVGLANDAIGEFGCAPSQILLNGYCPSQVDNSELKENETKIDHIPNDSGTMSSEPDDCTKIAHGAVLSDDGMSSLSTESGRSVLSSEYGIDVCLSDFVNNAIDAYKSSSATTDSGNCNAYGASAHTTPRVNSSIERERIEDLKDLPPHLATLVQKALHELDMRDLDEVIMRPQTHPMILAEEHAEEAFEYQS